MKWHSLTTEAELQALIDRSFTQPQVIFKHSTRCSVSSMVRSRLEGGKIPLGIDFHYLDLLAYRSLSNKIAGQFGVHHESPQVLIIKDGKCTYDESHMAIRMMDIEAEAM